MVIFHLIFCFFFFSITITETCQNKYWSTWFPSVPLCHYFPFPYSNIIFSPLTPQALLSLLLALQRHGLSYMEYRILHRQHPLTPKWKRKRRSKFPAYFSYSPSYRHLSQISNIDTISSLTSASKWINCDVLNTEDKILLTYTERQ